MEHRSSRACIIFSLGSIIGGLAIYVLFFSQSLNFLNINPSGTSDSTNDSTHEQSNTNTFYDNTITQANDAKMMADMKSIQTALEQYYAEYGFYPEGLTALTQDGYLSTIPINIVILDYQRPTPDSYTLTTNLSNGEKYTLSSEY